MALVVSAAAALLLVVQRWLGVPIAGSLPLFVGGMLLHLFAATSASILLATVAR